MFPKYKSYTKFTDFSTIFFKQLSKAEFIKFDRSVSTFCDLEREMIQNFCLNNLIFLCLDEQAQNLAIESGLYPSRDNFRRYVSKLRFLFDRIEKIDPFWFDSEKIIIHIRSLFVSDNCSCYEENLDGIKYMFNT